ncbi:MAG: ATP-dependent helicase [Bacteroidaceae bacterium]|jgi:DNA helicase-2/ATP-dependent DNA helicase PcrA
MPDSFLNDLNPSQRAAVEYCEGPSLVVAGAGSGKTRVLTYKIAYLLKQGVPPWNILALTFTNKAAREMKERIEALVGGEARRLWMGTFHSIFARMLRTEAEVIGFPSIFTIYDASDSRNLVKIIIREMALDDKTYRPNDVQNHISMLKNQLVSPQEYMEDRAAYEQDLRDGFPFFRDIYARYAQRLQQSSAMDFDDLLMKTYQLFDQHPEICARYRERFRYILVDEYQDTNYAQHKIVLQLAQDGQIPVCAVGDDAQSIYSFRGARIDNMLTFGELFPQARIFKLEQNYRSTQTIVDAAGSLIRKNEQQIPKKVFSEKEKGDRIEVFQAYSDTDEGAFVAKRLLELRRSQGASYSDFAVLYRTHAQSRVIEEAFRQRNMPYRIYGGVGFYQRKEVKDLVAYFRLSVNPHDEDAIRRVINYPARGIGATTLRKISEAALQQNTDLWSVIRNLPDASLGLTRGTLGKIAGFVQLVTDFAEQSAQLDAYTLADRIVRATGILTEIYADPSPEGLSRQENIQELMNGLRAFCDNTQEETGQVPRMEEFLSEASLQTDQDMADDGEATPRVTLMTIHSAKGLEFRNVFIAGLEENLFPSAMSLYSPRGIEEERRLFYVALTRAMEHCCLSYARSRYRYGKMEFSNPSRFLSDIDPQYLDVHSPGQGSGRPSFRSAGTSSEKSWGNFRKVQGLSEKVQGLSEKVSGLSPLSSLPRAKTGVPSAATGGLQPGMRVEHERFGQGEVLKVEGEGENAKATIQFDSCGQKQLLLRFARIKRL